MALQTTITAGRTRFQFYSDSLVRIEHSPSSFFRDWPTSVVINRKPGGTDVEVEQSGHEMVLRTSRLTIHCTPDRKHLTGDSLNIEWVRDGNSASWRLGDLDDQNLGGTLRALDGAGSGILPPVRGGALSRSKYFLFDDTDSPTCEPDTDILYPQKEEGYSDIYFFVYNDYCAALKALEDLTGRIPMIPRWTLGLWFSRYYAYTSADFANIAKGFERVGMPLDVMVLDVDWHKYGWEGFDWNTDLIPRPIELIKWLHDNGMRVSLNDHPGGLPDADSHAPDARTALGIKPSEPVRFNLANPEHARLYMEMFHRPLMDLGIDVWWIDGDAAQTDGLDSQHWTNRVYYNFTRAYSEARPVILSRYGGFGSQKYPIGFSGDVRSDWSALAYEVGFTSTAGNALMPYWSHDIGGFTGNCLDPQLYVRWFQFGAMSPFLRMHSDHGERAPWEYDEQVQTALKKSYDLRQSLIPFLYSLCYQVSSESLPLVRPLYLDWPNDEECYHREQQYTIGGSLMVCPVTHPAAKGQAHVDIYLPEGIWYDYETGDRYEGGRAITYSCPLDRIPAFARAGAIITAQQPSERTCTPCPDPLIIHLFAGADGDFTFYEDDGTTQSNANGKFTLIRFSAKHEGNTIRFAATPAEGSFPEWKPERNLQLRIFGIEVPARAMVQGKQQQFEYDTASGECSIELQADLHEGFEVALEDCSLAHTRETKNLPPLEVTAGLLHGINDAPPRLVVSAISASDRKDINVAVDVPRGWGIKRVEDVGINRRVFELQIPRVQPPGCYTITASASIGKTEHAQAQMDWQYASVTDFRVIGTFDNSGNSGMSIAYGPEVDFAYHTHSDGRPWVPLNEDAIRGDVVPVRYIDLTRHFGWISDVVAYAVTYIHTESARKVRFDLGADDGIIAWLNGHEILRAPEPGPAAPAQFRIPVELHAGWNQVMLKIGQLFGDWGFYFEVRTQDGNPAENLRVSNQPV